MDQGEEGGGIEHERLSRSSRAASSRRSRISSSLNETPSGTHDLLHPCDRGIQRAEPQLAVHQLDHQVVADLDSKCLPEVRRDDHPTAGRYSDLTTRHDSQLTCANLRIKRQTGQAGSSSCAAALARSPAAAATQRTGCGRSSGGRAQAYQDSGRRSRVERPQLR
jgi:hypothetical protein